MNNEFQTLTLEDLEKIFKDLDVELDGSYITEWEKDEYREENVGFIEVKDAYGELYLVPTHGRNNT